MTQGFQSKVDINEDTPTRAQPRTSPSQAQTGELGRIDIVSRPIPHIKGYDVRRPLGQGGMGEVYEAVDRLGMTYALKMIRFDCFRTGTLERFRQEARAMVPLRHPNVVRIYSFDETDDGPYFTMEYLPDRTLEDRKGSFVGKPREAVLLMIQIVDAVAYLHARGLVHRDLKPLNILFKETTPYVADLGLVKLLGEPDDSRRDSPFLAADTDDALTNQQTRPQHDTASIPGESKGVLGTLDYMAPELFAGQPRVSRQSDIWALGIILHELVHGLRPKLRPTTLANVDPALQAIIDRCLAPLPENRYPSANDLLTDLKRWLNPPRTSLASYRWLFPLPVALASLLLVAMLPRSTPSKGNSGPERLATIDFDERARESLAGGKAVTLIGEQGLPINGKKLAVSGCDEELRLEDCHFVIATQHMAAAELLNDPGIDNYRFRVQVRQESSIAPDMARVGLYFGRRIVTMPNGNLDQFSMFGIREQRSAGGQRHGEHSLNLWGLWYPDGEREPSPGLFTGLKWVLPFDQPAERPDRVWRELMVEMRPTEVKMFLDGRLVTTQRRTMPDHYLHMLDSMTSHPELLPATVDARGGLGVIVTRGVGSFRDAVIEPLGD